MDGSGDREQALLDYMRWRDARRARIVRIVIVAAIAALGIGWAVKARVDADNHHRREVCEYAGC